MSKRGRRRSHLCERSGRVERHEVPYPYRYHRIRCVSCGTQFVLGESLQSEGAVLEDGVLFFDALCPSEGCGARCAGFSGRDPVAVRKHLEELIAYVEACGVSGEVVYDELLNSDERLH